MAEEGSVRLLWISLKEKRHVTCALGLVISGQDLSTLTRGAVCVPSLLVGRKGHGKLRALGRMLIVTGFNPVDMATFQG